ncbi:ATP-grasp domain-containing protein [Desulfobulbus sp. US4]|nr:ATP-grasp domain-containing protein [Desulfobulbus sp. US4]
MEKHKKKILIAGGGYADIPLVRAAKKLGFHVITSGNRPEDLAHKESDEYCQADYSDPDAILSLAQKKRVDAICPCANDFSAISCSYVAEKLNLPGHDSYQTALLLHHKDLYRKFALLHDIPTPKAVSFSDLKEALGMINEFAYPLLVKPVDLTGGKGITKIENSGEIEAALKKAFSISKAKRIVVEEFVNGTRHGFSSFIRNGKVVFYFTDNEHYYLNPYMVSAASTPSSVSDKCIDDVIIQSEKITNILQLKDGILHIQFILNNGKPTIIEICRRPPGDLYIEFVRHATNIDYPLWIVKAFSDLDCSKIEQKKTNGCILRHCIMASKNGLLNNIKFSEEILGNIIDKITFWNKGDLIDNYLIQKFGIVFLRFENHHEMNTQIQKMQSLICPEII